jgi:membrane-associated phospholipid phosphatase
MMSQSPARLRVFPFIVGALICAVAFVGVYLLFVRSYMGQLVDERAFAGADAAQGGIVDIGRGFLDLLPALSVGIAAVLGVIIVVVRRNWLVFITAVTAVAAANVSTQVLKYVILARPERGVDDGLSNSLPSGHTTVAASAALAIYLLVAPRYRPLVAVIGSSYALVAGAATLVNQWHRPSDVIAALLVVAFWGCGAGFVLATSHARTVAPGPSRLGALVWIAIACALVGAVGLAVTYFSALAGASHLLVAYVGGLAAIAAFAYALTVLGHRLFRALA